MRKPVLILLVPMILTLPPFRAAQADGWESLSVAELIPRCRLIAVGKLWTPGRVQDGWRDGTLRVSQILYSGVGAVEKLDVRVAAKTVAGETQHWEGGTQGVWFVLKAGDSYEPLNHPSCWMDADDAEELCNQIYAWANQAYDDAMEALQAQSSGDDEGSDGDGDSSDSEQSVASYAALAEAAAAASGIPHQDEASQTSNFASQVQGMLDAAGIELRLPTDLNDVGQQDALISSASELLGLDQGMLQKLLRGDAAGLLGLQASLTRVLNELVRNTLGAADPLEALGRMKAIPLDLPQQRGGPPGARSPSFSLPRSALDGLAGGASRGQMLRGLLKPQGGGARPRPGPGPGGPGPGGPGPR